ncbi:MAG: ATP-binding protein [Actinobacteria bacterium]|nr:ATP-binding protein [Actinomycetota bacterium]
MLLRFGVENWTSFREPVELSLVAGRERQHGNRLPQVRKYRLRVLPVAAVYGGNASGKSNLFKAMMFAKQLVVKGTQPDALIPVRPFMLDPDSQKLPTRFAFEVLVNDVVYEYTFAVTSKRVFEESLTRVLSTSEHVLFRRIRDKIAFDDTLDLDRGQHLPFLEFAFRGTRANELFLTNSVSQNIADFRPVWEWFRDALTLIAPDASFEPSEMLLDSTNPLSSKVSRALVELDTGVVGLGAKEIRLEDLGLFAEIEADLRQLVRPGTTVRFRDLERNQRYLLSGDKRGTLKVRKLVAKHRRSDGTEVTFDLRNEADGTQRVIDLLPAFCDIEESGSRRVYVVDELDRSLHSLLTRQLLGSFLDSCSATTRAQLVFTTHDLLLMDQDLLRRDEMWVTERGANGSSALLSLSEYQDIRYDKDIRKSYLQGRLGGIPKLFFREACASARDEEE